MGMEYIKHIKYLLPLGMVSVVAYMTHVLLGQVLWPGYNPVTTDISSLTAVGSPDAALLRVFTTIYGVSFTLFIIGILITAWHQYHKVTTAGYIVFLVMALTSIFGYSLFPLAGDKTEMGFQNMMHIVVTVVVVFTTMASLYLLAYGYRKKEKLRTLGIFSLSAAILITVFGALNPMGMANGWNIHGLTERLVIFTLQAYVFSLSLLYTFGSRKREKDCERKS